MAKTVADQFAEILAAAGVKVYGVVGVSLNGLTDSPEKIRTEHRPAVLHMLDCFVAIA
jgi:hypothetical protein